MMPRLRGNYERDARSGLLLPRGLRGLERPRFMCGPGFFGGGSGGDPYYGNVKLLLHFDGANGSTTFTDNSSSPKTPSSISSVTLSTAQSYLGGASAYFSGTNSFFRYADSAAWTIGTSPFTIEAMVYRAASGTMNMIASQWSLGTATDNSFLFYIDTNDKLNFSYGSGGTNAGVASAASIPATTWTGVAVSGTPGGTVRLFIGGTMDANSLATVGAFNDSTQPLAIGAWQSGASWTNFWNGYLDELRLTIGTSRYSGNYTVATQEFPNA